MNNTKAGYAALVGRPNSGKSTLLNNILKHKVSITSPKPQTTRFNLQAVYEDKRGQIIFIDTPGIFGKAEDTLSKKINPLAQQALEQNIDVAIYLIDHSRERSYEENKIWGIVRNLETPKILAFNKIDIKNPSFLPQYMFMKEEVERVVRISALKRTNLNKLLDAVFDLLPVRNSLIDMKGRPTPAINIDSRMFIGEIIREKAFLFLRKEVPYTMTATVDSIEEKDDGIIYIKARIVTSSDRYKKMIIGKKGKMIKEIGMAARKELQTATNKKIFLDLKVETNPHWHEQLY